MSDIFWIILLGIIVGFLYSLFARLRQRAARKDKNSDIYWAILILILMVFIGVSWAMFQSSIIEAITFFVSGLVSATISSGITYKGQPVGINEPLPANDSQSEYVKRIVSTAEHFYKSISSKSKSRVKRSEVILDITAYCLYLTFKELIRTGHSMDTCKNTMKQLAERISSESNDDTSFSDFYMTHFMAFTEKLGIDCTPEEAKYKMTRYIKDEYGLDDATSVLESSLIDRLGELIKVESFVKTIKV